MATRSQEPDLHDILALIHMAFGQGAGTMIATPEAVRAGEAAYEKVLSPRNWDENALAVLEYSRAVGRVAAHIATDAASPIIDAKHVRAAIKKVGVNQAGPVRCPFCPSLRPGGLGSAGGGGAPGR
jgi:hypothetical protein